MKTTIEICMGSSCFARGNDRLLPIIEAYLIRHDLSECIRASGTAVEEIYAERGDLSEVFRQLTAAA